MAKAKESNKQLAAPAIEAWSFSRLQDWRLCPFKAYQKHVLKNKEPGSAAMERGSTIDKQAEDFTKPEAAKKPCPSELAKFEPEFRELQKRETTTQAQWTFRADWSLCGWFDSDAWCRIKTDLCFASGPNKVVVVDHKTGKINPAHDEQLKLYALGSLLTFPQIEEVDVRLWYLDHGVEKPDEPCVYTRKDAAPLKKYWMAQVRPMLADRRFPPKANMYCGRCHFRKANGGPCIF